MSYRFILLAPTAAIALAVGCAGNTPAPRPRDSEREILDRAIATADGPTAIDGGADEAPLPPVRVVATARNARIRLHPLEGGTLLVQAGPRVAHAWGGSLGKPELLGADVEHVFGRWPDELLVTAVERGNHVTYRWNRGARAPIGGDAWYLDVTSWVGGRLLALAETSSGATRFEVPGRKGEGKFLVEPGHCWEHAGSLPSGEVFALGKKCDTSTPIVGRWQDGSAKAVVDVLPGVDWPEVADVVTTHLGALSRTDIAVSLTYKPKQGPAKPYVAQFDGSRWLVIPVPQRRTKPTALARGLDGSIWFVLTDYDPLSADLQGELWQRTPSGAWRAAKLPEADVMPSRFVYSRAEGRYMPVPVVREWSPVDVWMAPSGEVWIAALVHDGSDEIWGLLHAGPEVKMPAGDGGAPAVPELPEVLRPAPPLATASCAGTFFVALGTLGRGHSQGDTFPTVREALARAGVEAAVLLEIYERGVRKVGVFTTSKALADRIVAINGLAPPERKLVATCEAPVAIRVVRFDAVGRVIED